MLDKFFSKNSISIFKYLTMRVSVAARISPKRPSLNLYRWNVATLLNSLDKHLIHYPTPVSLTYAWSFGSLAGICLVIQLITGMLMSMHYTATIPLAAHSIEYIMRDVPSGWFIRYTHSNGASMFFIAVYAHIFRGLYYGSYMKPRQLLWCSGVVLFLLLMGTAFTGYVLPWGQMSFWGATVITSMVTALPFGGNTVKEWLWGGFTIKEPTLKRFYTVHFVLPFIVSAVTVIHLLLLHQVGSSNPIGSDKGIDDIPFYPYFFSKDLVAFTIFLGVFAFLVFFYPNFLNDPDNLLEADPMETPPNLLPEWYFLPFYGILRVIPHKSTGIALMFLSIAVLFTIPFTYTGYIRNTTYRPVFKIFYWLWLGNFLVLLYLGQLKITPKVIEMGQWCTVHHFFFFVFVIPVVGIIENSLARYKTK